MKVVISSWGVFPFHGAGGQEKYPYYLARRLAQQGVEVEVVCSLEKGGKSRVQMHEGLRFVFLPPMCAWGKVIALRVLGFSWSLSRYLRGQSFSLLHSFTNTAYFYLHQGQRRPVVMQAFAMDPFEFPTFVQARGWRKLYLDNLVRRPWRYCMLHADGVTAENQGRWQRLVDFGVRPERLFILPQGIDLEVIRTLGHQGHLSRQELGIAPDDQLLLTVFRYNPENGLNYLVDAFAWLRQHLPKAKLLVVGRAIQPLEVATHKELLSQISHLGLDGHARCLVNVPEEELYRYYGMADVFISPTLRPAFLQITIQEAMACGLPIVSTGQEDLVKNGLNGYVVPKRDAPALAQAVLRICQEGRGREMGAASRQMIVEYDMADIARRAVDGYSRILADA